MIFDNRPGWLLIRGTGDFCYNGIRVICDNKRKVIFGDGHPCFLLTGAGDV